jgi:hypothetical protein
LAQQSLNRSPDILDSPGYCGRPLSEIREIRAFLPRRFLVQSEVTEADITDILHNDDPPGSDNFLFADQTIGKTMTRIDRR